MSHADRSVLASDWLIGSAVKMAKLTNACQLSTYNALICRATYKKKVKCVGNSVLTIINERIVLGI